MVQRRWCLSRVVISICAIFTPATVRDPMLCLGTRVCQVYYGVVAAFHVGVPYNLRFTTMFFYSWQGDDPSFGFMANSLLYVSEYKWG